MSERIRNADGTYAKTHGMRRSRLYRVWCAMKERCNNPHNKSYGRYGGRGITVCDEWRKSFSSFAEWAEETGYGDNLSIDRIDNNGPYSPNNCRWASVMEQNRNYSRNHLITYRGRTQCLADWADEMHINRATVLARIKAGKLLDEVFDQTDGRTKRWQKTTL